MTNPIITRLAESIAEIAVDNGEGRNAYARGGDAVVLVRAILAALDAAGWQCVPKVATEEMLRKLIPAMRNGSPIALCDARYAWRDALAAAPKGGGE